MRKITDIIYPLYPLKSDLVITDLISLSYQKCPRNFEFEGESHDFWEFVYIDKGEIIVTADKQNYLLKSGELAFHKPNEFHALSAYDNIAANIIVCAFKCKAEKSMRYFEHRFTRLDSAERAYLYEALQNSDTFFISVDNQNYPFGISQIIKSNLELMLISILRRSSSAEISSRIESYFQQSNIDAIFSNVNTYLELNICNNITLSKIATDLGYSVSQMKTAYQKKRKNGIINYFNQLKMDEAFRLLKEGKMNITEISMFLGYANPSYFTRVFKERFDMTPSECARAFHG